MFSGFSNQVTSWMGAVKGEPHDEDVPTPVVQPGEENAASFPTQSSPPLEEVPIIPESDDPNIQSPTKHGGMFSNVKSQMTGWLGNAAIPTMPSMPAMPAMPTMPAIPSIPGLRKGANTEEGINEVTLSPDKTAVAGEASGNNINVDDEDRSRYISATEGADSAPVSGPGTPDEKSGQVGMVTTKVTQGAKTFGSFLYSAVNKAGAKIKESVKDNNILGEFNKEQEAFIRGQPGSADAAIQPWIGHPNEDRVKEEILGLSSDRRNFVRAPPTGVEFDFKYDSSYPIAVSIMTDDPALEKMRFELVPKIITEENFWRNYFYRVSLICQASDLDIQNMPGDENTA